MVIKDIIYIMVVALFAVACWLQVESVPHGVKLLPFGLSTEEAVVACRFQVEYVPRGTRLFYAYK